MAANTTRPAMITLPNPARSPATAMSHQPTVIEHEHAHGHTHGQSDGGHGDHEPPSPGSASRMVRDPVCGMMVDAATALRSDIGGRTFFFCSSGCARSKRPTRSSDA